MKAEHAHQALIVMLQGEDVLPDQVALFAGLQEGLGVGQAIGMGHPRGHPGDAGVVGQVGDARRVLGPGRAQPQPGG